MMEFLKDFFLLRWSLPRWAIPTLWTVYFLNQFYMVFSEHELSAHGSPLAGHRHVAADCHK